MIYLAVWKQNINTARNFIKKKNQYVIKGWQQITRKYPKTYVTFSKLKFIKRNFFLLWGGVDSLRKDTTALLLEVSSLFLWQLLVCL